MDFAAGLRQDSGKRSRVSTKLLVDARLLVAIIVLIIAGLVLLYSASWNYSLQAYDSGTYILLRQISLLKYGILALIVMAFVINYRWLKNVAVFGWVGICLVLLVMLADVNSTAATGYNRSIFSNGSVQPSEFAKLALIICLASWLSSYMTDPAKRKYGFLPAFIVIVLEAGLVLVQPDFSAAVFIVMIGMMMLVIGGIDSRKLVLIILAGSVLGVAAYFTFDKIAVRFGDYFAGLNDPGSASYHMRRAYNAILNGGIFGVGFGKSVSKITGLPVAWTDSIFAVVLEETGLVGGSLVVALYTYILYRGCVIARKTEDVFGKLLAAGLSIWIFSEAALNIMVIIGMMPFAGNALPLISYGGSSMMVTMIAFGLILNISRVSARENLLKEEEKPDALINMRRRDWGWRISRPGSKAGNK